MKNRTKYRYLNLSGGGPTEDPKPFLSHQVALVRQGDGRITIRCRHDRCKFRVRDIGDVARAEELAREHLAEPLDQGMRERRGLAHWRRGMWFH